MDQNEFISAIKVAVEEPSRQSIKIRLESPSGKAPSEHLLKLAAWYNKLSDSDKIMIESVIEQTVDITIFGFLCVLDGVTAIERGPNKGKLNLFYEKGGESKLLNDTKEDYLHDMW
jgi:hypothetical protein